MAQIPPQELIAKTATLVLPAFVPEYRSLILFRTPGEHTDVIFRTLLNDPHPAKQLFEYGLSRLPRDPNTADPELSAFFMIVSKLLDLDDEVRGFATELVAYAKNGQDAFSTIRADEIDAAYARIKPRL